MLVNHDDMPIIAQCTPQGSGALALLRMSGSSVRHIASKMGRLASGKQLTSLPTHTIHFGWIVDTAGTRIDQVMFLLMHGPKTFTGQDVVEITCHNNQALVEHIIQLAISHGARLAQQGEFTKRAVLNNKMDLIQAEAINELIHANTQTALKQSLAQLEGSLSGWISRIEKQLVKALAFSEASFEFIDEESLEFEQQIKSIIKAELDAIARIKKTFDQQQQIREGVRIAIVGSVNAGKSSLLNALLGKDRAIVTNQAGTTRDTIEAGVYKSGNHWTLVDTAGLRETDDAIEQAGIKRSFEEAHKADIVLLLFDGSREMSSAERTVYEQLITQYRKKIMVVRNKIDQASHEANPLCMQANLDISTTRLTNIAQLEQALEEKIASLFAKSESPFLLNGRQFKLILNLENKLKEIASMLSKPVQYELLSYHLNDALAQLSELTGKSISERGMDAVFREFCVGK